MTLFAATPGGSTQSLSGAILGDGIVAPDLVGQQNDFAPPYVQGSTLISMRLREALSITGMLAGKPWELRWLKNDSTFTATLVHGNGDSAAANRFNLGGANLTLAPGMSAGLIYNPLAALWDLLTVSSNAAAPPTGAIVTFGPEETIVLDAGDNDDLTPSAGIANVNRLLLDASAGNAVITGIVAGSDGQSLLLTSINSANEIELPNEDAGSDPANQFYGVGPTLIERGSQLIVYSGTLGRWIQI